MTADSAFYRAKTHLRTLVDTAVLGARWFTLERPWSRPKPRQRTGRHLALFAQSLPPSTNAGVYRPLSFIRYGCELGWRIDAFCSEPPSKLREHGEELLSRIPPEATLHVVPPASRQPSYRYFPRIDGEFTNALEYARYAIALMAKDPPDVVLASGPPFFTFVAARLVARRFGVPLVLDYRDEWTECPFDFVSKSGHDRVWERRCLHDADAILFTTVSHLKHQLVTFPEIDPGKAYVVPNGWEPGDFIEREDERRVVQPGEAATLRIAHVGNLAGHAPPHEFLESLQQLLSEDPEWVSRIRIQFIGRHSNSADRAIGAFEFPGVVEIIDHVAKREANRRMQESDALLLLASHDLARYLPGKLFDYLAARRPVLVFGSRGESSALIDQLNAGVFCPSGSAAALREALVRLRELDMSRNDDSVRAWLQEHRRDALAARAFDIIEGAVVRARNSPVGYRLRAAAL